MTEDFRWNPYADQPHNVAPKGERFRHHWKHADSYLSMLFWNGLRTIPILSRYRRYRREMYVHPVKIEDPFAAAVSPAGERNEEVVKTLLAAGIRQALVRIPSWEQDSLEAHDDLIRRLGREGVDVTLALLQRRADVLNPHGWETFLHAVFSRFADRCSAFEIGHAWNRTKWGVWDHQEYLRLAFPAVELAKQFNARLVGPAVIDFEFHLYPPVLRRVPFDIVSSFLYVDRMGAPENRQYGWDTSKKLALLKAVIDGCGQGKRDLWITEVNWPLEGTGKYSPASGKPNVSEKQQADYLVRYYILTLASGLVERIFWWQLVAPGYGLIDNRPRQWRKRESFHALKTLAAFIRGGIFEGRLEHSRARLFRFQNHGRSFVAAWTSESSFELTWPGKIVEIRSLTGKALPIRNGRIVISGSPQFIFTDDGDLKFDSAGPEWNSDPYDPKG